jgi:hypothetical protein
MLAVLGKSSEMYGRTPIFLRAAFLERKQSSSANRYVNPGKRAGSAGQFRVLPRRDGLGTVTVLPQLKVNRLCSVVASTADFDPKPTCQPVGRQRGNGEDGAQQVGTGKIPEGHDHSIDRHW